jgi:hypothetical protein
VPGEGLEPSRACAHKILSLACIPFHHPGKLRPGRELHPRITVLQTVALLLGYLANLARLFYIIFSLFSITEPAKGGEG